VGDTVVTIEQMARDYLAAIKTVQPQGPYLLGGHSFGGVVAYEMAQCLWAEGEAVGLLVMFDTHSPRYDQRLPLDDYAGMLVSLAWVTARQRGEKLLLPIDTLRQLNPDEQLKYFFDEMKKYDLLQMDAEIEYLKRFLHGFRERNAALRRYEAKVYPGKITVLKCREADALFNQKLVEAGIDPHEPSLGWGELSLEPVDLRIVDGHHDRLTSEPYVSDVAEKLRVCIDECARI
jgi:thioesterase domain-containing protein